MESAAEERLSVYESRKRRSWNSFLQYLTMHKPLQSVQTCTGADAIDFFKYLDRFGKTKIHTVDCQSFGNPNPNLGLYCGCPSRQGWWSLETVVERLRSAYKEFVLVVNAADGCLNPNPFSSTVVVEYMKGFREEHERSKGVAFEPKRRNNKRKKNVELEESQCQGQPSSDDHVGNSEPQSNDSPELLYSATTQSRYEERKQQAWNSFTRYLKTDKPSLMIENCSSRDVVQFLEYLNQFGKTKVHLSSCFYFGVPTSFVLCGCPLKQSWSNLDTLVERLRAAYGEHCGRNVDSNPFGSLEVREYLKKVKSEQENARGVSCKRRKQGLKNLLNPYKKGSYCSSDEKTRTDPTSDKDTELGREKVANIDSNISDFGTVRTTLSGVSSDEALDSSVNHRNMVTQLITEPIWRGSFSTQLESFSFFYGLVVLMSNNASLKDIESARILPARLHLELLPRIDVWPQEFYHVSPTDSDVIFHFLQEKQSLAEDFDVLVDHITTHDLALRAVLDDYEILIFSSLKLQADHQKNDGTHYLWGLFIRNSASLRIEEGTCIGILACTQCI
ncbi:unnamed protein product [Rhodiola kirilowii]